MTKQGLYLIAEIGQAHEGSLGNLYSYIDALAETGVDAVKFQMHIAEAESSKFEPFRIRFSLEDDTRFEYWKRMGFSLDQWKGIKKHCEDLNIDFLCSPFSNLSVDWLEEIGVTQYKIGSGEVTNLLLLEKIARTGKPVILSSGLSSFAELDDATDFLSERKIEFSILQCTTSYPTLPHQYGLNVIQDLKKRYGVRVGYSDHSARISTAISAITLGAEIVEFHVVFDRRQFGPDSKSSLTIDEVQNLVVLSKDLVNGLNNPIDKSIEQDYIELKNIFEKSLAINKKVTKGHIITFDDLEAKKPKGLGIDAKYFADIVGKKLSKNKNKWDFINPGDIQD